MASSSPFSSLRRKAETDLHLGQGYYSHADILALLDEIDRLRGTDPETLRNICPASPAGGVGGGDVGGE